MALLPVVNEGTTHVVQVSFTDEDGAAFTPEEVAARVDNVATGAEVRGWTAETPAQSLDIEITPAENA
ncbi:MAG TPA: hypothetical protein ENK19_10060, partial [Acidobacteria bacterium]|nr:hypothetical protein [Acidobacteriota bacterium]